MFALFLRLQCQPLHGPDQHNSQLLDADLQPNFSSGVLFEIFRRYTLNISLKSFLEEKDSVQRNDNQHVCKQYQCREPDLLYLSLWICSHCVK